MKWSSSQGCRLYTRLNLIRQHPEKGFTLLLSPSASVCGTVCQVCIIPPDIVFLPSNRVPRVVTTFPSKHLSKEKSASPGLPITRCANGYPSIERGRKFARPKGRRGRDLRKPGKGRNTSHQATISKREAASPAILWFPFVFSPLNLLPGFFLNPPFPNSNLEISASFHLALTLRKD